MLHIISAGVAAKRNVSQAKAEVKRFRAERRSCKLGESPDGVEELCPPSDGETECRLCEAIRTGFGRSLEIKQQAVREGAA